MSQWHLPAATVIKYTIDHVLLASDLATQAGVWKNLGFRKGRQLLDTLKFRLVFPKRN